MSNRMRRRITTAKREEIEKEQKLLDSTIVRPFEVLEGLPVSYGAPPGHYEEILKNPLTVKDAAVLYNSLLRSRNTFVYHAPMFKLHWVRQTAYAKKLAEMDKEKQREVLEDRENKRRFAKATANSLEAHFRQPVLTSDINARDVMSKLCESAITLGPHTMDIRIYIAKDARSDKSKRGEPLAPGPGDQTLCLNRAFSTLPPLEPRQETPNVSSGGKFNEDSNNIENANFSENRNAKETSNDSGSKGEKATQEEAPSEAQSANYQLRKDQSPVYHFPKEKPLEENQQDRSAVQPAAQSEQSEERSENPVQVEETKSGAEDSTDSISLELKESDLKEKPEQAVELLAGLVKEVEKSQANAVDKMEIDQPSKDSHVQEATEKVETNVSDFEMKELCDGSRDMSQKPDECKQSLAFEHENEAAIDKEGDTERLVENISEANLEKEVNEKLERPIKEEKAQEKQEEEQEQNGIEIKEENEKQNKEQEQEEGREDEEEDEEEEEEEQEEEDNFDFDFDSDSEPNDAHSRRAKKINDMDGDFELGREPKKRRGGPRGPRPKKQKSSAEPPRRLSRLQQEANKPPPSPSPPPPTLPLKPKGKRRGRPPLKPRPEVEDRQETKQEEAETTMPASAAPVIKKRGRGRPRIHPIVEKKEEPKEEVAPPILEEPPKLEPEPEQQPPPPPPPPSNFQSIESYIMIENLNTIALTDLSLNDLMRDVALGTASEAEVDRFKLYIEQAKRMGPQPHHAEIYFQRGLPLPPNFPRYPTRPVYDPQAAYRQRQLNALKLTAFQERYLYNATLVIEFHENANVRYIIPQDSICEVIEAELPVPEDAEEGTEYKDILFSHIWIHNMDEVVRFEKALAEYDAEVVKYKKEEEERKKFVQENERREAEGLPLLEEPVSNEARSLRKKKTSGKKTDDAPQMPPDPNLKYTTYSFTLHNIPTKFVPIVVNSARPTPEIRARMENVLRLGTRVSSYYLWYRLDARLDEKLAESLRNKGVEEEKDMPGLVPPVEPKKRKTPQNKNSKKKGKDGSPDARPVVLGYPMTAKGYTPVLNTGVTGPEDGTF